MVKCICRTGVWRDGFGREISCGRQEHRSSSSPLLFHLGSLPFFNNVSCQNSLKSIKISSSWHFLIADTVFQNHLEMCDTLHVSPPAFLCTTLSTIYSFSRHDEHASLPGTSVKLAQHALDGNLASLPLWSSPGALSLSHGIIIIPRTSISSPWPLQACLLSWAAALGVCKLLRSNPMSKDHLRNVGAKSLHEPIMNCQAIPWHCHFRPVSKGYKFTPGLLQVASLLTLTLTNRFDIIQIANSPKRL